MLPHRITMPQAQGMTPHPVTVYRHRADLSLCYPYWCGTSHWNRQLPILMSSVRPDRGIFRRPSTLKSERANAQFYGAVRNSVESVPYPPGLEPGTCGVRIHYTNHSHTAASAIVRKFIFSRRVASFIRYRDLAALKIWLINSLFRRHPLNSHPN